MKRILIVTEVLPPNYGGADIAAIRYANFLYQKNPVSVFCLAGWNKDFYKYKDEYPFIIPIKIVRLKSNYWRTKRLVEILNFGICTATVFWKLFKLRDDFDVIHSFNSWSNINLSSLRVGKWLGKIVITETCLIGADDPETILKRIPKDCFSVNPFRRNAFFCADIFVSKSAYIGALYERELPKRCNVQIPYFVDTKKFYPLDIIEKEGLRQKLDFPREAKIIMFAGELNSRKGLLTLVKAFKKLAVKYPNLFLLLVGPDSPSETDYVQRVYSELNEINKSFYKRIAHNSNDIHLYMKIADFYCLPSLKEGFPISIIEAMCSGLAIVASDIPEINGPQINHNSNGLVFKVGDEIDLANQFDSLLSDKIFMGQIKKKALESSVKRFHVEKVFEQYENLYN